MAHLPDDELLKNYWALGVKPRRPEIRRETTALLCIDLQYLDAHPDHGFGAKARELGIADFMGGYWERLRMVVLPNVKRLQSAARKAGVEVIHCRIEMTSRGDRATRFGRAGVGDLLDSSGTDFLPEVAPEGNELVIPKFTQSPFNSTNIDRLLRNMGIRDLVIVGVVTEGCVESTARSAAEHDYGVYVVEDGCAAVDMRLHENSLLALSTVNAAIARTDEIVRELEGLGREVSLEPEPKSTVGAGQRK